MSPKWRVTRSRTGWMLKRLPPYSGIMASTRVTFAPPSTRRRARVDPIKPSPPVIITRLPRKASARGSTGKAHLLQAVGPRRGDGTNVCRRQADEQRQRQYLAGQALADRQRPGPIAQVGISGLAVDRDGVVD